MFEDLIFKILLCLPESNELIWEQMGFLWTYQNWAKNQTDVDKSHLISGQFRPIMRIVAWLWSLNGYIWLTNSSNLEAKHIFNSHLIGSFQCVKFQVITLYFQHDRNNYESIPIYQMDGLVQERCNSSALAMELRFSSTNPLICLNRMIAIVLGLCQYKL